eukprot:99542_1
MGSNNHILWLISIILISIMILILYYVADGALPVFPPTNYINYHYPSDSTNTEYNDTRMFQLFESSFIVPNKINSRNFELKIVDLVNNKCNYTPKYAKHIVFNNISYVDVPFQYRNCITTDCQLDDNISIIIHNEIGSGKHADVFNVSIKNNQSEMSDFLVLKREKTNHAYSGHPCEKYKKDHILLRKIEHLSKYYNLSVLNVPLLVPSISIYETDHYCLRFTKLLSNVLTWNETVVSAEKMLPSIISKKRNLMKFLVDCYSDIMNVFYILYELGIYHNDLHSRNLLIDKNTFKCYVIDFGYIFERHDILKRIHYTCLVTTCSPVTWYYLKGLRQRKRFMRSIYKHHRRVKWQSENVTQILFKFGLYGKQYEVATRIFHTFVKLYYLQQNEQNSILFKMNEKIIEKWWNKKEYDTNDISLKFVWCTRYKLYSHIMNEIQNTNSDIFTSDIKERFIRIINVIGDDWFFLNITKCQF